MAPVSKHRGAARQPDLSLEKYLPRIEGVPDETVLGRLQEALEILLSERSHPMIVGLSKQLEQLQNAENVMQREIDARKKPSSIEVSGVKRKRSRHGSHPDRETSSSTGNGSEHADTSIISEATKSSNFRRSQRMDKVESGNNADGNSNINDIDDVDELHERDSETEADLIVTKKRKKGEVEAPNDNTTDSLESSEGGVDKAYNSGLREGPGKDIAAGGDVNKNVKEEKADEEVSVTDSPSESINSASNEQGGDDKDVNTEEKTNETDTKDQKEYNVTGDKLKDDSPIKETEETIETQQDQENVETQEGEEEEEEEEEEDKKEGYANSKDNDKHGDGVVNDEAAEAMVKDDDNDNELNTGAISSKKPVDPSKHSNGGAGAATGTAGLSGGDTTTKIAGNRKFVTNPKSEFVSTQTLPYHTLGIFNEENEDEDEEMHKRRLGVVSYPKEDLSTLTAGPVPMEDFTRAKPANQVQFSTYATFLEPYFRPFTDEDIQFLQQSAVGSGIEAANLQGGKRLSPFVFPPLGPHYRQQWAAQDAELSNVELTEAEKEAAAAHVARLSELTKPIGGTNDINDSNLEAQSVKFSLGPFTERLVAAVMTEAHDTPATASSTPAAGSGSSASAGLISSDADDSTALVDGISTTTQIEKSISAIPPAPTGTQLIEDFGHLEERIKNEFRYVGVLDVALLRKFEKSKSEFKLALPRSRDDYTDLSTLEMDWINGAEDDEISRELRLLQRRLREVSRRNAFYKAKLIPVVQEQLSWQEYQSILQDLDKQVDQAYQKRLKQPKVLTQKPKKRKGSVGFDSPGADVGSPIASTPEPSAVSKIPDQKPAIKALIDKRERWISKIGPLFRPSYEMMREYLHPKFEDIDEDDAADEEDEEERDD